jgi:hypothetical protein
MIDELNQNLLASFIGDNKFASKFYLMFVIK